jgi:hypothetical protein
MKPLTIAASISSALLLATGGIMVTKTATARPIVNPTEQMITLPAFTDLGPSRISTVKACELEVKPYKMLITDDDFLTFGRCLYDYT